VELTGTLYTPPGHDPQRDGRLPCLLWAYPREFKSKVGCRCRCCLQIVWDMAQTRPCTCGLSCQGACRVAQACGMHAQRATSRDTDDEPDSMSALNVFLHLQDAAGQLRQSQHTFSGVSPMSPLLWLARGYAILVRHLLCI